MNEEERRCTLHVRCECGYANDVAFVAKANESPREGLERQVVNRINAHIQKLIREHVESWQKKHPILTKLRLTSLFICTGRKPYTLAKENER